MRIALTRPREHAQRLAERLEELGHEVVVYPLIEIEPTGPPEVDVSRYDWLVVTSRNAAAEVAGRVRGRLPRIAAIGPGTADALRERGIEPTVVASVSTQEGLLAELPRPAGRVLFAGAERARRVLIDALAADFVPLYKTRELVPRAFPDADVVVLASASAARAYGRLGTAVPAVSIGPQTTAAAREHGVEIVAEAQEHDVEGLVAAVVRLASPG